MKAQKKLTGWSHGLIVAQKKTKGLGTVVQSTKEARTEAHVKSKHKRKQTGQLAHVLRAQKETN